MHRLKETNTQGNIKLCSFDITNMYSYIPQKERVQVINNALQNNNVNTEQKRKEKLLINTILNQNYIQHNNHQNNGSVVSRVILANIFLLEDSHTTKTCSSLSSKNEQSCCVNGINPPSPGSYACNRMQTPKIKNNSIF
jgi:hypothetical protein